MAGIVFDNEVVLAFAFFDGTPFVISAANIFFNFVLVPEARVMREPGAYRLAVVGLGKAFEFHVTLCRRANF